MYLEFCNTFRKKIYKYYDDLLGICLFSIPFSLRLNVFFIGLTIFLGLFLIDYKNIKNRLNNKKLFFLISFYLINILFIFKSCDIHNGLMVLEQRFSLLLFPLLLFLIPINYNLDKILKYVVFSSAFIFLYCFIRSNILYYYFEGNEHNLFWYGNFYNNQVVKIHPGYFNVFVLISIAFIMKKIYAISKKHIFLWLILLLLFLFSIFYMGSKTTFLLLPFVIIFSVFSYEKNRKKIFFFLFSFLALMAVLSIITFYRIPANSYGGFKTTYYIVNEIYNSDRIGILKAVKTYYFEHKGILLWGVGTGCILNKLLLTYKSLGLDYHYQMGFDSHNIFIDALLGQGILGLFSILILFQGISLKGYKTNKLYFLFCIIFFCFGLIENFLSRQWGIVFFAIVNTLFVLKNNYVKN